MGTPSISRPTRTDTHWHAPSRRFSKFFSSKVRIPRLWWPGGLYFPIIPDPGRTQHHSVRMLFGIRTVNTSCPLPTAYIEICYWYLMMMMLVCFMLASVAYHWCIHNSFSQDCSLDLIAASVALEILSVFHVHYNNLFEFKILCFKDDQIPEWRSIRDVSTTCVCGPW